MNRTDATGPRVTAIVLAAGLARRFGGDKLAAILDGRPILQHALDALAAAGIDDPVVVLGPHTEPLDAAVEWRRARRVRNEDPGQGLASSLRLGWAAAVAGDPLPDAVIVALGDQPSIEPGVIVRLAREPLDPRRPVVVARHVDGSGNPVRLEPEAALLVGEASGDRGLGPLLDRRPDLVRELRIEAANPDVDRPEDLARLVAAAWSRRVRANRDQVERFRLTPDGDDFYAPVTTTFVADPGRTDDPVLDVLTGMATMDDVWLDIGAGAGRYALPLALRVTSVVAVDPSASMLEALGAQARAASITNVRPRAGRWPPDEALRAELGPDPVADVALMAHVGYDIDAIEPFVEAAERAVRRRCVAVLMVESPAAVAAPFWPLVHGEDRIGLPALPHFLELLAARGAQPEVVMVAGEPRRWGSRDALVSFLRRQLWVAPGTEADRGLDRAIAALAVTTPDGATALVGSTPRDVGVVTWSPHGA